jgi:hypothetical protein
MSNNWIPISIQNESHVETRMFVTLELIVTVWWVIMSALGSHVYLWRKRHPRLDQIHVYTVAHGLDVSLQLVLSRHPSSPFNIMIFWIQRHRGGYSLWQPLPSHVHLWRNSHPEVAQIHALTHSGIFDCFYTALVFSTSAKSFNHKDTAYLCPLHVLFVNRYHPMIICDPTGNRKSLKSKFIRSVATGDRKSFKYKFTHSTYILSDNDCHTMCFCAEIGTTKSLEFTVL